MAKKKQLMTAMDMQPLQVVRVVRGMPEGKAILAMHSQMYLMIYLVGLGAVGAVEADVNRLLAGQTYVITWPYPWSRHTRVSKKNLFQ
jgi:hypothetical protein